MGGHPAITTAAVKPLTVPTRVGSAAMLPGLQRDVPRRL